MIRCCSTKFSFDKILGYVEKAKKAGGEVICGGTGSSPPLPPPSSVANQMNV